MPIQAQLADGRTLEFPDGTEQSVIQATVKRLIGEGASAPAAAPEAQPTPSIADPMGTGAAEIMAQPTSDKERRSGESVAEWASRTGVADQVPFNPAEAERLSRRDYAEATKAQAERGVAVGKQMQQIAAAQRNRLRQAAEAEDYGFTDFAKDSGIDLSKGAVGLGQAYVGLLNLTTGGAASRVLGRMGYDPEKTNKFLNGLQSITRQNARANVEEAKGFVGTLQALAVNPTELIGSIVESLPGTVAAGAQGGALTRFLMEKAAAEATARGLAGEAASRFIRDRVVEQTGKIALAASAGEGVQTTGSIAEQAARKGRDWSDYVAPALSAGLGTAAIGALSGKVGRAMGIGDVETDIAARSAGLTGISSSRGTAARAIVGEMGKEGLLEELPQSAQEQIFTNLATGRPWDEGVAEAAAQGAVAGAGMGGGHAAFSKVKERMGEVVQANLDKLGTPEPTMTPEQLARSKGFLTPEAAPAEPAPTEAAPAPTEAATPAETEAVLPEAQTRIDQLVRHGVPRQDAEAMVLGAQVAPALPNRVEELTQEFIDAGVPPQEAQQRAVAQAQEEQDADSLAQREAGGEQPIPGADRTGVQVAGQPGAVPTAAGVGVPEPTGMVPTEQDVGVAGAGEGQQPTALIEGGAGVEAPTQVSVPTAAAVEGEAPTALEAVEAVAPEAPKRGRGRPALAPEQKEAAEAARKQQRLAANQAKRNVDKAEALLTKSQEPIDESAYDNDEAVAAAQDEQLTNQRAAIRTLYQLSRENKGKPGHRAAEILKGVQNQRLVQDAKAAYEYQKTGKISRSDQGAAAVGPADAGFSKATNGVQALSHVIKTGNAFQKFLARRLRGFVNNVKFVVIEQGDPLPEQLKKPVNLREWERSRGLYIENSQTRERTVYVRGASFGEDQGVNNVTVLHELLHAATNTKLGQALQAIQNGYSTDSKLVGVYNDLLRTMNSAGQRFNELARAGKLPPHISALARYGNLFEDPKEFVAYGMSDPVFQEFLMGAKGFEEDTSFFTRFVDAVRRFFNMGDDTVNALSDLMVVTDKLLSTRMTPTMRLAEYGMPEQVSAQAKKADAQKEKTRAVDHAFRVVDKSIKAEEIAKQTSILQRLRSLDVAPLLEEADEGFSYAQRQVVARMVPTPTLADIGGKHIPELKNIWQLLHRMDGMKMDMLNAGTLTIDRIRRAVEPSRLELFNRAVLTATVAKVDPRIDRSDARMNKLYNSLTDKEKTAFAEYFDYYAGMYDYVGHLLEENVKALNTNNVDELVKELRDMFKRENRIQPYAPLARDQDGKYWLQVGKGKDAEFYTRKSRTERNRLAKVLAAERNTTVEQLRQDGEMDIGNNLADLRSRITDSSDLLRKLFNEIEDADFKATTAGPSLQHLKDGLKDSFFQMWLQLQPENSARKQFIHRRKYPPAGFKTDTIQNLSVSVVKLSHNASRLKYAPQLRRSVMQAKSLVPSVEEYAPYVEQMARRVDDTLAPYTPSMWDGVAQFTNAYTFGYYMSESTAVVQLLGAYQMGVPQLVKKHSVADVTKTLARMGAVWNTMGVTDENGNFTMPTLSQGAKFDSLERRALEEMHRLNVAESTAARDLQGYKDLPTEKYGTKLDKAKRAGRFVVSGIIHAAERISREVVYMSSFVLNREKAVAQFKQSQQYKDAADKTAAIEAFENSKFDEWTQEAARDTDTALFNYSESAKPMFMRNAPAKFALQFFTYRLNAATFLLRNLLGMIKPLDGETRKECMRAFIAVMGTTWTLAGVSGMFGFATVLGFISSLLKRLKDKDEPDELKDADIIEAYKAQLHELLGHVKLGGAPLDKVIDQGPLNAFTGLDFQSRTSLNDVAAIPEVREARTPREGVLNYVEWAMGPQLRALQSNVEGVGLLMDGDYARGLEKVVPWATARNKLVATRYALEGETSLRLGDEVLAAKDFKLGELVGQAVGFRPVIVADVANANRKATALVAKFSAERADILKAIDRADQKGNLAEEIRTREEKDKFNDKYRNLFPRMLIDDADVTRYKASKDKARAATWAGFTHKPEYDIAVSDILQRSREALVQREKEMAEARKK